MTSDIARKVRMHAEIAEKLVGEPSDATTSMYEAADEIERLRKRLEIHTCYDGDLNEIPVKDPDTFPDGITCRDATIKLLEESNERLRAELAKYQWQPINTAPRDGTPILVSGGTMVYELGEDEPNKSMVKVTGETWSTNWYAVDTCGYMVEVHNPTHWMPLPQPPKENVTIFVDGKEIETGEPLSFPIREGKTKGNNRRNPPTTPRPIPPKGQKGDRND